MIFLAAGHQVTLYEAGEYTGGLAAGFHDESWEWPLERYYHHLFTSDKHIIRLAQEIGLAEKLFFPRPITSVLYDGRIVPFDSPKAWVSFPVSIRLTWLALAWSAPICALPNPGGDWNDKPPTPG